ncbi:hypothetical protein Tco_0077512 [Tanacetum coccineum]
MGHSPEFAAPTKRFKWSAGSVDRRIMRCWLGHVYSGHENSIILRCARASLMFHERLLLRSRLINLLFLPCGSSIGVLRTSISKFQRGGVPLLGRLDPPELHL